MRALARACLVLALSTGFLAIVGNAMAGQTPTTLQDTNTLIWVIVAISVVGASLTRGVMTYALWRFRDPNTKGRRYG
jgi:hypothetical protein